MTAGTGYAARARTYAAEIGDVPAPHMLHALLRPGLRVAEMPSATGHFLATYAASGAEVTLVDVCPDMLQVARSRATELRISPKTVCCRIEDLQPDHGPVDLALFPNAALNQLAAETPPGDLLTAAGRILPPGAFALVQLLPPPGQRADQPCGFYDPAIADGEWITDRELSDGSGRRLVRRRRQRHVGMLLQVDFELTRDGDPAPLYAQTVRLRQLTVRDLAAAAAVAGLTLAGIWPGASGLYEALTVRTAGSNR